jgi:drug/metabolite transporter (DMT)-like permease
MWNIILSSIFRNEQISARAFSCIFAASAGSVLINLDPTISVSDKKSDNSWGLLMALIMTLTESIMFTIIKSVGWTDPAQIVWITNSWASVWMIVVQFFGEIVDPHMTSSFSIATFSWEAILMTMFHSVSLFSGYWLRNYAITRLSTTTFSILSYSGLLAAYLFGIVFVKETPGWMSVLGAATILVSGVYLLINPT